MPIRPPRVFTIPAGAPFLPTLSHALLEGVLIEGFPGAGGATALAEATIYVPTQRAAQALARALLSASGRQSLVLPRIAPLGAFEPDEGATVLAGEDDEAPRPSLPRAVGALSRLHALATQTRAWGKALRGAIRTVDADGGLVVDASEPALVAATPAEAYALAGDLAALIDDMIIEGAPWAKIETLAPEAYDRYWGITLNFLKIAFAHWPQWLTEHGVIDRAKRTALLIDDEIKALEGGARRGPTIIAGSTGANRATARLIAAIARAPQGAVALPDLDLNLDDDAWAMIGASDAASQSLATHPQALLRRLIGEIGVRREDVVRLGARSPTLAARSAFLTEALRPADSTERWRERDGALSPPAVAAAFADMTIIVADNETEEALALAIAMRETLETPGKTAALITPDPSIARRVAAELERWSVEVEDSAGLTLGQSAAGALARLILDAAKAFTPRAFLALLAHPSARFGRARAEVESAARALELAVFRATPLASLDDLEGAFARAREAAASRHAHPATRGVGEAGRERAERLARDVARALAPLRALGPCASLRDCLALHRAALLEARQGPSTDEPHGLEPVLELLDEWREAADGDFPATLREYAVLLDDALARERAPPSGGGHPRLQILGLLEARLLSFDCALLAGLDETVWPPAVETDAFLNRPMRAALGLSAPERRIGQTAHDFVAALGAREAILSRAKKRGGEPTVASRFLQRVAAAAGAGSDAYARAEGRGARFLGFARALDRPSEIKPTRRPAPRPPVRLRPRGLSVTRIETLRRDPYAIYAEFILRLKALEPVERGMDAREIGTAWHAALEAFAQVCSDGGLPPDAGERLHAIARERFAHLRADPVFAALNWPQIELGLDYFLDFERRSRIGVRRVWVEREGSILIPLSGGADFKLSARADRIDELDSGEGRLIDYKSGRVPSPLEVKVGFAPQLTLEAAILRRGGFEGLPALEAAEALYLKLGGASGGAERPAAGEEDFAPIVERHFAELKILLDQFEHKDTPYLSRPFPQFASRFSDYDHLARVKEWSTADSESEPAEPA